MLNFLRQTAVVIASVVLAFGIGEIALRLYLADDYGPPNSREWEQRFKKRNSLNHRDREFSATKPAGTIRVLAVGDSCTFGEGVNEPSALYTEILEDRLNNQKTSTRYEVLNVAERGMNVAEYLESIKRFGPAYDVDAVLIGFFINDIEQDKEDRPQQLRLLPYRLHSCLFRISYVYWHSYSALNGVLNNERFMDYRLSYSSVNSDHWRRFIHIWNEILDICRINNWPVAVALLPYLIQLDESYPFLDVHSRVKAVSESQGALVVDLFSAVKGCRANDLHVGRTNQHPNEKAHKLFAGELFRSLRKSGFLQRVRSGPSGVGQ